MRKSTGEIEFLTVIVGVFVALFILVAVVACNGGGGGGNTYYYPQDTSHGYYDTHHHYHYYPKYNPKSRSYVKPKSGGFGVKVKPAPKSGGGFSFRKSSGGSGFKSSGGSSFRKR
jgi:uncharacterized membrane protein YgcG